MAQHTTSLRLNIARLLFYTYLFCICLFCGCLFGLACYIAAFHFRCLASCTTKVVELAAACFTLAHYFYACDKRAMKEEDPLHAFAIGYAMQRNCLGCSAPTACNAGTGKLLEALFAALFNNTDAHAERISDAKVGDVFFSLLFFKLLNQHVFTHVFSPK